MSKGTEGGSGAEKSPPTGESPPLSLRKRILFSLILLAISLGVALVVGEVIVRLAAPQQLIMVRPDIWAPADSLGWHHASGLDTEVNTGERTVRFVTDSEGFRVGAEGRRTASDSILLIGDSFVAALQVEYEESLAGLIEDSISGASGTGVAVRNSGVGAWGPWHYLIFGRRRLAAHTYDLVLVSVFVGNDIVQQRRDYIEPRTPAARPRFRIPLTFLPRDWIEGVARPINEALESRSHLYVLLKNRSESLRIRLGLTSLYVPKGIIAERADGPEWEVTGNILADLAAVAESHDVPMVFVLIPARYQVNEDLFRGHARAFGIDSSTVELEQPNRRLREELIARGLEVVDVLPAFRAAAGRGQRLYGTIDPHLTPAGHTVLFDLLRGPIERHVR